MKTKVFLILALLCAVVQGAWADWSVWSGYNSSLPTYYSNYGGRSNVYVIRDAKELAGVTWYWGNYFDKNLYLDGDMDMTAASWQRMGDQNYTGTFYGNNHTIRIKISEVTENYQGLFYRVGSRAGCRTCTWTPTSGA